MKHRRLYSQPRLGRDVERLIWLAQGLADAGSRVEDAYWEAELTALVDKLMADGGEEAFIQALDRLSESNLRGYDELADLVESRAESTLLEAEGGPRQILLVAMPILAWSRFNIPARAIPADALAALRAQLSAHVLADGTRLALADHLYSPDQLPKGYVETRRLVTAMAEVALAGQDHRIEGRALDESGQYISDARYLLGAVAVPPSGAVFRWNEPDGQRDEALRQWRDQGGATLQTLMTGCVLEAILPDAYFAAWRRADRDGRPFSLITASAYLEATLAIAPTDLWAAVAPFQDHKVREWRIGFGRKGEDEVLYGVVWPLLGAEDESADVAGEIAQVLKQPGVGRVTVLDQRMPLEYCDDCGAPLFPNLDGEPTHAGMPEADDDAPPVQLH